MTGAARSRGQFAAVALAGALAGGAVATWFAGADTPSNRAPSAKTDKRAPKRTAEGGSSRVRIAELEGEVRGLKKRLKERKAFERYARALGEDSETQAAPTPSTDDTNSAESRSAPSGAAPTEAQPEQIRMLLYDQMEAVGRLAEARADGAQVRPATPEQWRQRILRVSPESRADEPSE